VPQPLARPSLDANKSFSNTQREKYIVLISSLRVLIRNIIPTRLPDSERYLLLAVDSKIKTKGNKNAVGRARNGKNCVFDYTYQPRRPLRDRVRCFRVVEFYELTVRVKK